MDSEFKVLITDYGFDGVDQEKSVIEAAGGQLFHGQYKTEAEIIKAAKGMDGLIVQFSDITEKIIKSLNRCKVIIRYGIGYDNIDLAAAKEMGIVVCNVPDYCIDEVADHTLALALSLARQIPFIDKRTRGGVFKMAPVSPMGALNEMVFGTIGLGRIAQSVLQRAQGFGFKLAAFDPYLSDDVFEAKSVRRMDLDTLFREADILSLHSPLSDENRHLINEASLAKMKNSAIIVNTSRGGLIDIDALAAALQSKTVGYAGLDVYETEPLPADSAIRACDNAVLTSHVAFYSESSVKKLQRMAAEELVRGIKGKPVNNRVA